MSCQIEQINLFCLQISRKFSFQLLFLYLNAIILRTNTSCISEIFLIAIAVKLNNILIILIIKIFILRPFIITKYDKY